ncbi:AAA family ATPase [Methylosinus sp. H3A]|uniref:division plane positioning ATPase MipZ n=1 Tax=Methylosinus sp. H3A TaxID=2785786 RepID=UPI0018C21CBE|nr:division plane positioning ATPase MipZ [Methylosinus sp. H3A]MBG0811007.1 AAA family ATPase [Methylosinus sp. H3A]
MRTIAFVTQKGGAGKSTLASSIAVAASCAGERVFIIDLDPLQSLVKWSKAREATDVPVEHVPPAKLGKALAALEKKGVTLVVIDAPGADSEYSDAAIRAADLCIVPARPNVFDLWACELTRASIKDKKKDYAFLLNQCPPAQQNARVDQGAQALQAIGALLAPLVSARVDYQEAARMGLGVCELNPEGVAAEEMRELWQSVKRRLKKGAPVVKAEPKVEAKVEAKPAAKAEAKPVAKVEAKTVAKTEAKAETKPTAKVAGKITPKQEQPVAARKQAAAPAAEKAAKPQAKPAVRKAA